MRRGEIMKRQKRMQMQMKMQMKMKMKMRDERWHFTQMLARMGESEWI